MSNFEEINAIRDVAKLYFDGTHYSDGDKMELAFVQGCQIVGQSMREERDNWIASIRKRPSPNSKGAAYDYEIQSITVDDGIATAKLRTPINDMVFTDIMTLLKGEDGVWRVYTKVFRRQTEA